jgi:hypothetical protein
MPEQAVRCDGSGGKEKGVANPEQMRIIRGKAAQNWILKGWQSVTSLGSL